MPDPPVLPLPVSTVAALVALDALPLPPAVSKVAALTGASPGLVDGPTAELDRPAWFEGEGLPPPLPLLLRSLRGATIGHLVTRFSAARRSASALSVVVAPPPPWDRGRRGRIGVSRSSSSSSGRVKGLYASNWCALGFAMFASEVLMRRKGGRRRLPRPPSLVPLLSCWAADVVLPVASELRGNRGSCMWDELLTSSSCCSPVRCR